MSNLPRASALAVLTAGLLIGSAAYASDAAVPLQPPPEDAVVSGVVVEPPRVIQRNRNGGVTEEMKIRVRVPYGDLDMATPAGVAELDKRVAEAATYACRQLERMYPNGAPERRECAREAIDDAQPQVLIARVNG